MDRRLALIALDVTTLANLLCALSIAASTRGSAELAAALTFAQHQAERITAELEALRTNPPAD